MSRCEQSSEEARRAEQRRALAEELDEFLDSWRELRGGDGWVPLRLMPTTGLVAWELAHAGLIEIDHGYVRPRS